LVFTSDRRLIGEFANRPWTTALAILVIVLILFLNGLLVYQLLGGIF
jgi:manganese transport protein